MRWMPQAVSIALRPSVRAHLGQRAFGGVAIQRHAAAEEEAGIVVAQQQVGVGHRGLGAAARVARRPRIGARRMRTDAQQSHLVDRGDRAAAGADLDHVDDRRLDRQAGAFLEAMHARRFHHRRDLGAAVLDQAGLRRGAAHVERDHVGMAGGSAEERGGEAAAGGTALQHADREVARGLRRQQAAGGVHEAQLAAEAAGVQLALQLGDVAAHQRLHIGVGAGGVAALVLPQLRHHVGRDGDRDVGERRADDGRCLLLMRWIAVGVEEADGDRLDPFGYQALRHGAHLVGIERGQHVAVAVDAFRHLQAMAARHQRVGELQEQVVDVVALLGAHLQDVAEAARGDQAQARAGALDQGVGDQGGAVDHVADVGERELGGVQQFGEALQRADRGVVRRGQALVEADFVALRVEQDEVGEGAADVETDTIAGGGGHSGVPESAAGELCTAAEGVSRVGYRVASVRVWGLDSTRRTKSRARRATEKKHEMRFARSACCFFSVALRGSPLFSVVKLLAGPRQGRWRSFARAHTWRGLLPGSRPGPLRSSQ